MAQSQRGLDLETEATWQAHYIKWAEIFGIPDPCSYYEGFIRIVAIYNKYIHCGVSRFFVLQRYKDTPRWSITVSNLDASAHPPIYPTQTTLRQSSSTTCYGKRILQGSVLCLTTIFLLSYIKWPQPANARIQSVTSFLRRGSWLLHRASPEQMCPDHSR
jgi:hypothetical protein